uniref:Uncharacterized protein n=1 Tax=Solanum lycopersicum TaxID=4081 RepID=A0A3Q7GA38_SOLLC
MENNNFDSKVNINFAIKIVVPHSSLQRRSLALLEISGNSTMEDEQQRMSIDNEEDMAYASDNVMQTWCHSILSNQILNLRCPTWEKLEDAIKETGLQIKHHDDNIKFLEGQKNRLDDSILDLEAAISVQLQKHTGAQITNIPFMKDIIGIVALLGKVYDDNLSSPCSRDYSTRSFCPNQDYSMWLPDGEDLRQIV